MKNFCKSSSSVPEIMSGTFVDSIFSNYETVTFFKKKFQKKNFQKKNHQMNTTQQKSESSDNHVVAFKDNDDVKAIDTQRRYLEKIAKKYKEELRQKMSKNQETEKN